MGDKSCAVTWGRQCQTAWLERDGVCGQVQDSQSPAVLATPGEGARVHLNCGNTAMPREAMALMKEPYPARDRVTGLTGGSDGEQDVKIERQSSLIVLKSTAFGVRTMTTTSWREEERKDGRALPCEGAGCDEVRAYHCGLRSAGIFPPPGQYANF